MLAIVFWNSRRTRTDATLYREALIDFHQTLNGDRPKGFRFSAVFGVESVPWLKSNCEVYEDWYVLSNFAALDELDKAVIERADMDAHRFLMKNTAVASGAVLGLSAGLPKVSEMTEAYWMARPRDVEATEIMNGATHQLGGGAGSFWTRAMALGPYGNCLLTTNPVEIPSAYGALHRHREVVWSPSIS